MQPPPLPAVVGVFGAMQCCMARLQHQSELRLAIMLPETEGCCVGSIGKKSPDADGSSSVRDQVDACA